MQRTDFSQMTCSIARSLAVAGEPWSPLVLRDVWVGINRFDDLQRDLGIARNVLRDRLGRLVEEGLLERRPYSDRPPRSEYHLTEQGRDLWPVLHALLRYGDRWYAPDGPPRRILHRDCGGEADDRRICSRCGAQLGVNDVVAVPPAAGPRAA